MNWLLGFTDLFPAGTTLDKFSLWRLCSSGSDLRDIPFRVSQTVCWPLLAPTPLTGCSNDPRRPNAIRLLSTCPNSKLRDGCQVYNLPEDRCLLASSVCISLFHLTAARSLLSISFVEPTTIFSDYNGILFHNRTRCPPSCRHSCSIRQAREWYRSSHGLPNDQLCGLSSQCCYPHPPVESNSLSSASGSFTREYRVGCGRPKLHVFSSWNIHVCFSLIIIFSCP